ncbi:hypothetical protein SEA_SCOOBYDOOBYDOO_108 [Mycobacterium phage ScoobyDoobyDoo]|nr:hypothetical protein SEA_SCOOBYDOOBYDOO_108 [Mycobacterium phage ScoobyDoobyDoo]
MTNFVYDKGREGFLNGQINWTGDTIKVVLVDTASYTPNQASHQYLSDIASGARTFISGALTGKGSAAGVASAANLTMTGVTGNQSEALVIFKDTGNAATSNLICYLDTVGSGLPVLPNGGPIIITWFTGGAIFKL